MRHVKDRRISVNRAPVLTFWAAAVAERLGFDPDEALSLGKAFAGLTAQTKGQRLGIYEPKPKEAEKARAQEPGEVFRVELMGRAVPAVNTEKGVCALAKSRPISPAAVKRYLERKFGDALPEVRKALKALANAFEPQELARRAFHLYEQFRPEVPEGAQGWGAKGVLDLDRIRELRSAYAPRGRHGTVRSRRSRSPRSLMPVHEPVS
jgi:hypothetical protein